MTSKKPTRSRDPERTRTVVLDAAEAHFAAHGYEGSSLQAIAADAGVSRGTPGYAFGSKEGLYRAVLERLLEDVRTRLWQAPAPTDPDDGRQALARAIEAYIDFLVQRPTFVRLLDWEALRPRTDLRALPPHAAMLSETLAAVGEELTRGSGRALDPHQWLLSVMGACWFPLSHAETLMPALGLDPFAPDFVEARKRHVIDLVLHGPDAPEASA